MSTFHHYHLLFIVLICFQVLPILCKRCSTDSECLFGRVCESGRCVELRGCRMHWDCARKGLRHECSAGKCVRSRYQLCRRKRDCTMPRFCIEQQCKTLMNTGGRLPIGIPGQPVRRG